MDLGPALPGGHDGPSPGNGVDAAVGGRQGPLDGRTPALLVKIGRYPQHQGGLGVVRTLGRAGVPVHAVVEHPCTPTAVSRHLSRRFVWPTTGLESPGELVARLHSIGLAIGTPCVPVATDDEAAVLLAEHAEELSDVFLLPPVPPGLPRRLASKADLYEICRRHGVPTPRSCAPAGLEEILDCGRQWGFPLVLKNREAWTRLARPAVEATTIVSDLATLRAVMAPRAGRPVLVQEYLPPEHCEDWFTHLCCGPGGEPLLVFTGRKRRSWPPDAGVTTRACSLPNPELAAMATDLCRKVGYAGVADLDWRLDRRDGRYKLVDFNPRTGAQFRLFETVSGIDVVRALHMSLTGLRPPVESQLVRDYGLGNLDLASASVWAWRHRRLPPRTTRLPARTERSWLAADDPAPALVELGWLAGSVARRITARAARRARRTDPPQPSLTDGPSPAKPHGVPGVALDRRGPGPRPADGPAPDTGAQVEEPYAEP
ncbi:ATP-grasp domain-containing protein [Kitasatospora sp. NPDC101176]|uniref:carboxylate--amine ligase n=1 Tax=Kitasatospora sp. NPDC101176 TaxID=3364099 RepID=UPI003808DD3F